MKAAQAFHSDDPVLAQEGHRLFDGAVPGPQGAPGAIEQAQAGAAGRAANGLGVVAAVVGGLVLALAVGAHREPGHGGVGPVVGDVAHDGEARPAVGAVDERVPVTPVGGVEQLAQAVGAGGRVGRDQGPALAGGVAGRDLKAAPADGGQRCRHQSFYYRQRRSLGLEAPQELRHCLSSALHLDERPGHVVAHRTAEVQ